MTAACPVVSEVAELRRQDVVWASSRKYDARCRWCSSNEGIWRKLHFAHIRSGDIRFAWLDTPSPSTSTWMCSVYMIFTAWPNCLSREFSEAI